MQAVLHDVDGQVHVAVSPDDDPAAELQRSHGRFLYFAPGRDRAHRAHCPIETTGSTGVPS